MMTCCWPIAFSCIMITGLLGYTNTKGQTSSSMQSAASQNILAYFSNEIGENAHLYTGKEYAPAERGVRGHPFFNSAQMEKNDIFYDGTLYTNIPLIFDIVRQEIVINRYDGFTRMKLLNEKVKYFTFAGHRFENLLLAEGKNENTASGIYDVVFDGKAKVLVKRFKRIKSALKAEDPPSYVQEDEFFIVRGNTLYPVDSKGSLFQAFNDQKELIKAFARKNRFRLKKNIEKEIILATAYYSSLNN